tara:strand:+ start:244 stop:966 length:723 start_codon:yes stop_codon:yes gene_type:complete
MKNIAIKNSHLIELNNIDSIWDYLNNIDNEKGPLYFSLGKRPYNQIWELQKLLHNKRKDDKIPDIILFLEHDHVYTFGKNADTNNLLDSKPINADVIQIDRGGEVTYHGPGQLVCYPIIDLHNYKLSVSWYMRILENVVMKSLNSFGISANQKKGLSGVWVEDSKICAMGVRLAQWVSMHGFAINVNPNMKYFDSMIPCGLFEYGVTSLDELDISCNMNDLEIKIMNSFNYYLSRDLNEI